MHPLSIRRHSIGHALEGVAIVISITCVAVAAFFPGLLP